MAEPGSNDVSRRGFLKLAGLGLGALFGAGLPKAVHASPQELEVQTFNPDILLQNPSTLTREHLLQIAGRLLEGQQVFGFEKTKEWLESIKTSTRMLKSISELHRAISAKQRQPERETQLALIERDYHELATMVWYVLKSIERFKGQPEKFAPIKEPRHTQEEFDDMAKQAFHLYGKQLDTLWMHWQILSVGKTDYHTTPSLFYVLSDPKYLGHFFKSEHDFRSDWYMSDDQIAERKEELDKTDGPKFTEITGDISEEDAILMLGQLHQQRLARVAHTINIVPYKFPAGGYSANGSVTLFLPEHILHALYENDLGWQEVQLHEIGHAIWSLLRLIPDAQKRSEFRARIHAMIQSFSPTRTVEAYTHPPGPFRSSDQEHVFQLNNLSEASLNAYPSGYFIEDLKTHMERILQTLTPDAVFPKLSSDYDLSNTSLNLLEQALLVRAQKIALDLRRGERIPFHALDGIERLPDNKVVTGIALPLAFLEYVRTNKKRVVELALQSNSDYNEEDIELLLDGFLLENDMQIDFSSGNELFAQIFQAALRKDDPNITVPFAGDRLDIMHTLITEILDSLIANKLAKKDTGKEVV